MDATAFVQSPLMKRASVTIPANASAADTLANLASLTADEKLRCIGVKINGVDTAGADRGAIICGDSTGSLPQYIASGSAYQEPVTRDAVNTYVKAASGAALTNVCVVFYLMAVAQ